MIRARALVSLAAVMSAILVSSRARASDGDRDLIGDVTNKLNSNDYKISSRVRENGFESGTEDRIFIGREQYFSWRHGHWSKSTRPMLPLVIDGISAFSDCRLLGYETVNA